MAITLEEAVTKMNGFAQAVFRDRANAFVDIAAELTGSKLGYFATMNETEDELIMLGWSRTAMDSCAMIDKPLVYPLEATGLWGDCVRERQAVITNNYENCEKETKKGYPDGHVTVVHHMNIPVWEGNHIAGVLGVGNKDVPYESKDAELLGKYAQAVWSVAKP
ncbi:MAG: GAF domain-containing protein [Caldisericia bacterium]|nr:GAF domain-containing protein [Caldisericia bacterium]